MRLRRRSVLLRVALLVLVPLVFLAGLVTYTVTTSVTGALTLIRSEVMLDDLGQPVASLQQALSRERAQTIVYYARPTPAALAALKRQQAVTDRAVAAVMAATGSSSAGQSASAGGQKTIAALRNGLASLPGLRAQITERSVSGEQAFAAYNGMIGASYRVLEQAIIQQGNSTQVLPRIAVIELAISKALEDRLVASGKPGQAPPVRPVTWDRTIAALSAQTQRAVGQAEARLASGARSQASAKLRKLYLAGGLGLAAVVASLILCWWIAVNLARQLHGLRDSALEMATVRLPDVVRRLRAGQDVDFAAQLPQLEAGADEIGQVKTAFNTAQRIAVQAAVDEARVRRGIDDVFRNLARRSQSLLERQMALLDALERRAAEPDDLAGLFRLDHLTTRMRRHAESLIVLAGDSPRRAFRDPVPFVDVLRAAAAEVEDYTRIKVISRTPAALAGPAVADVIHLLAEFVENATIFAPSNTEVRMTGDLVANGYAVDIEDRGRGMSDEQLAAVNASLADPPMFDLSGSDQLGLFVAAQLARRHGIRATVRQSGYGGVTAIALIPRDLVVLADPIGPGVVPGRTPGGRMTPGPTENGLPQRVRQTSLALQLRGAALPRDGASR
jgi:signal transduction histidine kinase